MRIRLALHAVLLICSLSCNAQSKRSNELFAQGVELYKAEKYREAIPVFEQVDAIDCQEMDSTDARNGYAKSWLSSCWYKLGDVEKAKD